MDMEIETISSVTGMSREQIRSLQSSILNHG